jgi:uncharacterized Ntn-hydrolase superfamily protein
LGGGGDVMSKMTQYKVGHDGYVSEFTRFIDAFLDTHPDVIEDQRRGWYIWWDHQIDLKELDKARTDTVPLTANHYP